MTKKRIALISLAILVALLAGVLFVLNMKFELMAAPRVSHEEFTSPESTRAVVLVNVPMAKDLIQRKTNAPGWALPKVLPYEGAVVVDVERFLGDVKMKLFVNEKRMAPMILQAVNEAKLPAPYDQWFKEPMRSERRGVLLREGVTACSRLTCATIEKHWKSVEGVPDVLRVENGHLLEVVVDNRDGSALAIAAVIADAMHRRLDDFLNSTVMPFIEMVGALRVQADLVSDNEANVVLKLECVETADPNLVNTLQSMAEVGLMQAEGFSAMFGFPMKGEMTRDGNTFVFDCKVSNVEKLLARF